MTGTTKHPRQPKGSPTNQVMYGPAEYSPPLDEAAIRAAQMERDCRAMCPDYCGRNIRAWRNLYKGIWWWHGTESSPVSCCASAIREAEHQAKKHAPGTAARATGKDAHGNQIGRPE